VPDHQQESGFRPNDALPRRKHLRRLDRIFVPGAPLFFLTVCVRERLGVLANPTIAGILVDAWRDSGSDHGWLVGRFVVMPDHVHFFAAPADRSPKGLSAYLRYWKRSTAHEIRRSLPTFAWQREFFDHLLRSAESYGEKWEYVRENPVRAGLVADASQWPFQGEIAPLAW
jgi:REP element-mobilizing transposase RayT